MSKHWSDYGNTEEDGLTIMRLTAEIEKLKRIVEVLEKSNEFYASKASYSDTHKALPQKHYRIIAIVDCETEDGMTKFGGKTARQAKAEVERIRKGDGK